jgi:hypothetical protein
MDWNGTKIHDFLDKVGESPIERRHDRAIEKRGTIRRGPVTTERSSDRIVRACVVRDVGHRESERGRTARE